MPVKYVGAYKQVKIKASSVTFFNIVISELNYMWGKRRALYFPYIDCPLPWALVKDCSKILLLTSGRQDTNTKEYYSEQEL